MISPKSLANIDCELQLEYEFTKNIYSVLAALVCGGLQRTDWRASTK